MNRVHDNDNSIYIREIGSLINTVSCCKNLALVDMMFTA